MKIFFPIAAVFLSLSPLRAGAEENRRSVETDIIQLLSSGKQEAAEDKLAKILQGDSQDFKCRFLLAVLSRSRFDVRGAAPAFAATMKSQPNSPEGLASACVLGVDLSRDQCSALYYFNALLIVCDQNPNSVPLHWLAAVMTRTLTRIQNHFDFGSEVRDRILLCGVREYETVLALMAPGQGPVLIHQTMANLLDDLDGKDLSLAHREAAVRLERAPWSLQAEASTLRELGCAAEALPLVQEAIAKAGSYDAEDNAMYRDTLGHVYWNLNRRTEAMDAWAKACELEPTNQRYLKNIVIRSKDLGKYEAARKYTRQAITNDSDDRFFKIWDARFAAMLGEPGAGVLVQQAGAFDFNGDAIDFGELSTDPWFAALETGDFQKVHQLIGTEDINKREEEYSKTALMIAAGNGWESIAAELIKAGAKLDEVDKNQDTALHYSAQFINPRVMKLLLDAGAKTDLQDKWKQTPLIMCVKGHNLDGFQMLLEKNADINLATPRGGTALHYAVGWSNITMVKSLIDCGANVNTLSERYGATPLIAVSEYAHSDNISPLLNAGADVNAQDKDGRSALYHAVNPLLNIPLVETLLEKGADPTLKDNGGITPITHARLLGFDEIADMMEKKIHRAETFQFAQFAPPDASLSPEMQNATYFVVPILLAQGDPLGRPSGIPEGDQKAARKELLRMFGIQNEKGFEEVMAALKTFEPLYRDDDAELAASLTHQEIKTLLRNAIQSIHASCNTLGADETAWIKSHIIYLADMGISAGFIPQEEGDKLMADASSDLSRAFSSWPQYLESFMLGARMNCGWEAQRYRNICKRIPDVIPRWK